MEIDYLVDHPEFIPALARWHHAQWSDLSPEGTFENRMEELRAHVRGRIPTTVVAHAGGVLLGSASLVESDMDTRPDLTPWLASVFVAPEHRRRGIGSVLVERVVDEARALGFVTLHLFTMDQEPLYAGLGWSVLERGCYRDHDVVVMHRRLGPLS